MKGFRILLGLAFLVCITLFLCGLWHRQLFWMAELQFLPSLLALNFVVVAGLLLLTLLFGRIYCSVICPLGIFMDFFNGLRSRIFRYRRWGFSAERKWLRYGFFALFCLLLLGGVQVLVALIAPYSAYGRMVRTVLALADGSAWDLPYLAVTLAALLTFVMIVLLAFFGGRVWCNTVCPVGTFLGFFSRFSLLRPMIDAEKCISCGKCERGCKASCIDIRNKRIDYSRCVVCFDCLSDCKFGAMKYRFAYGRLPKEEADPAADSGRRRFLAVSALLLGGALSARAKSFTGDAAAQPLRPRPVPPGAGSRAHFFSKCTACQLCVTACPNGVLRPSTDLQHLMQPEMFFDKGYCRPECNACSQVCPTDAIRPFAPEQKPDIHFGYASVDLERCVVNTDGVHCGNCARHCPVGAIRMVAPAQGGNKRPVVDAERCIGCGACEHLCPAKPVAAIRVTGRELHIVDY